MRGVIFDLDGVIVDTAEMHFRAWQRLASDLGIPFTRADNERLKGVSRMRSLDIILQLGRRTASPDQKQQWANQKNRHYQRLIEKLTPADVLPGILPLLADLESHGIRDLGQQSCQRQGKSRCLSHDPTPPFVRPLAPKESNQRASLRVGSRISYLIY